MTGARSVLLLAPEDNVLIALADLPAGREVFDADRRIEVRRAVPFGHKIARRDIAAGETILKFGQPIGVATQAIAKGAHVHSHNLALPDAGGWAAPTAATGAAAPKLPARRTFDGYKRPDGRVGTRNMIALCATVNCSATVVQRAALELGMDGSLDPYPNVDAVVAFAHGSGCGMASGTEGAILLERTLWGHATHPNVAAALFVGLGCEVFQVEQMKRRFGSGNASAPPQQRLLDRASR